MVSSEVAAVINEGPPPTDFSEPGSCSIMDPVVIEALSASFDPSDSFRISLLGLSPVGGTPREAP